MSLGQACRKPRRPLRRRRRPPGCPVRPARRSTRRPRRVPGRSVARQQPGHCRIGGQQTQPQQRGAPQPRWWLHASGQASASGDSQCKCLGASVFTSLSPGCLADARGRRAGAHRKTGSVTRRQKGADPARRAAPPACWRREPAARSPRSMTAKLFASSTERTAGLGRGVVPANEQDVLLTAGQGRQQPYERDVVEGLDHAGARHGEKLGARLRPRARPGRLARPLTAVAARCRGPAGPPRKPSRSGEELDQMRTLTIRNARSHSLV